MKQIVTTRTGGPDVLKVQEKADQVPGDGEIRIRVVATGVNFADIMARLGAYPDAPPLPAAMGYEVSGCVDAVGPNVTGFKVDDEVLAFTRFGGMADKVVTNAAYVVRKPAGLSHIDAASIPVVFVTAWMLIVISGGLRKGQSILIQNAGGGVGLAAIDIARHIGARAIGTASAKKHAFLKSRGLDACIDYTTQDVNAEVLRLTDGKGVDLIIDPVGGDAWMKNFAILRKGGRLGVFGASALQPAVSASLPAKVWGVASFMLNIPKWSPLTLMDQNKGVFGVNLGHFWDEPERIHEYLQEILDGVEQGWARPCVDKVFDFDHAGDAHKFIEDRKNVGKVILVPTAEAATEWVTANNK